MDKEKVLTLSDYYSRDLKNLLNPMGDSDPAAIASKIAGVINDLKRSETGNEKDLNAARMLINEKVVKYNDAIFTAWINDLSTVFEDETDKAINEVIAFYIQRAGLTKEEKAFYKEIQSQR